MSDYFIYYASANMVGAVIFGIMLIHDCLGVDRQEKQIKYDQALIAFMLYFISDVIWAGFDSGVFPSSRLSALITNFSNFVIMTGIIYCWLKFVLAVEEVSNRNSMKLRLLLSLPFRISVLILVVTYIINPLLLIDENLKSTRVFDLFLVVVPYIYLVAIIVYTIKKARHTVDPTEKKKHLYIGFFPILVVIGGLLQMLLMPTLPIFCFSSNIFMLIFFIKSIDSQISTDPLTKLNNRGQFARYISQESNLRIDGRKTFAIMMDINDFKMINDTYGHAEGDKALIILSQALVHAVRNQNMPLFLGRYGGDEFVMIAHPEESHEIEVLIETIRNFVAAKCEKENKPYILSIGIGYDEYLDNQEAFSKCMRRADEKLYTDKENCKKNGKSTICK